MSTDAPVPPVLLEHDAMKFEYTRGGKVVVLEVEAVRSAETGMVMGVIVVELVAAACEQSMNAASSALTSLLSSSKSSIDTVSLNTSCFYIL